MLLTYDQYLDIIYNEFEKFTGRDKEIFDSEDYLNDCATDDEIYQILFNIEVALEEKGIECDLKSYVWYYFSFDDIARDLVEDAAEIENFKQV